MHGKADFVQVFKNLTIDTLKNKFVISYPNNNKHNEQYCKSFDILAINLIPYLF